MTLGVIDVLVLTALKEELDALLEVHAPMREPWVVNDGDLPLHVAVLDGCAGPIRVAAARVTKMGGIATATLASRLIEAVKPAGLAMCGVCAGHPEDTELGDVVIAERTFQHDEGKIRGDGFQGDLWVDALRDDWLRVAQHMAGPATQFAIYATPSEEDWKWWFLMHLTAGRDPLKSPGLRRYVPDERRSEFLQILRTERLVTLKGKTFALTKAGRTKLDEHSVIRGTLVTSHPFHILVGPMGSGNAVHADGKIWMRLASGGMRKILAVEMEAAAIGRVAQERGLRFAVVKGVMDHAGPDKTDRFKAFAARAAAEVLCRFLCNVFKPERRRCPDEIAEIAAFADSNPTHSAQDTHDGLERVPVDLDQSLQIPGRSAHPRPKRDHVAELRSFVKDAYSTQKRLRMLVKHLGQRVPADLSYDDELELVVDSLLHQTSIDELLNDTWINHPERRDWILRYAARIQPSWEPSAENPAPDPTLVAELSAATRAALRRGSLPSGETMERPELERLVQLLEKPDKRLIVLIGEGGSGKSTLLADLHERLQERGIVPIAVRLDRLTRDSATKKDLQQHLGLSRPLVDAARTVAASAPTVVLLDQFDALCEVMSRSTRRLDLVLQTLDQLLRTPELRVVVACRPMEYEYDERLRQLDPEIVHLTLPPWSEIATRVADARVPLETIREELREELRLPLVLSTFLRLLKGDHSPTGLSTYYKMRRALWNDHVGTGEGHEARKQALYELADWLIEHEQSARPTDGMDIHLGALRELARAGFVVFQGCDREFVEFRHQSYLEFALARSIVDTEKSLDPLIRGQRFRVRRRLWHVLADLREGNPSHYKHQLRTQWPGLRRHLQCLVLEYLGSLPNPQDYEIGLMRRALEAPELSSHAWRAAGRTPAWFKHLAGRQLPECMADREHDGRAFAVLTQGLAAHTDEVVALVDRYWMADPQRVVRAARLLQPLKVCTDATHAILVKIAGSLGLRAEHHAILYLVEAIGKLSPRTAIHMLTAAIDSDVKRWENQPLAYFRVQAEERRRSSLFDFPEEDMEARAKDLKKEAFCTIFEEDLDFSRVYDLVSHESRRFVFPVLGSLTRGQQALPAPGYDDGAYNKTLHWPDRHWISSGSLIYLLASAVANLAIADPDAFVDLLDRFQSSEFMAVHHLLLGGLAEIAERRPNRVYEYFRRDPRRMRIETYARASGSTIGFFESVGPRLPGATQSLLARVFVEWTSPDAAIWSEDIREALDRRDRDIRLALLATLDPRWLAEDVRAEVAAYRSTDATDPASNDDHHDGSAEHDAPELTVPAAELRTWPDDRLLAHLLESSDSAPNSLWNAEEFAKLVAEDPSRGHRLIDDIPLATHETLVVRTIDALIRAGADTVRVLELFWRHERAGFSDQSWRRLAMALPRIAERDGENGLPDDVCRRLRAQLSRCERGNAWRAPAEKERGSESILYPHNGSTVFSSTTLEILLCLFAGYARRVPREYDSWMDVLDEHLAHNDDVQVWQSLASRVLWWIPAAEAERAERFIERLRSQYPHLTSSREWFLLIDRAQDRLNRETSRRWFEEVCSDGDLWRDQVFGELLVLRAFRCPDDPWPREQIDSLPASKAAIRRGVVVMLVRFIRDGHEFDPAMAWLERMALFEDEHISSALHSAVWKFRDQRPCVSGGRLLGCFARTPFHLRHGHSYNLLHVLEQYLDDYPELVADVCEKLLEITGGHTGDPRELLRLILAIEAKDDLAEDGLRMFERACDLELYGTHELLLPQ